MKLIHLVWPFQSRRNTTTTKYIHSSNERRIKDLRQKKNQEKNCLALLSLRIMRSSNVEYSRMQLALKLSIAYERQMLSAQSWAIWLWLNTKPTQIHFPHHRMAMGTKNPTKLKSTTVECVNIRHTEIKCWASHFNMSDGAVDASTCQMFHAISIALN